MYLDFWFCGLFFTSTAWLGFILKLNFSSRSSRQSAKKNAGSTTPARQTTTTARPASNISIMGDSHGILKLETRLGDCSNFLETKPDWSWHSSASFTGQMWYLNYTKCTVSNPTTLLVRVSWVIYAETPKLLNKTILVKLVTWSIENIIVI